MNNPYKHNLQDKGNLILHCVNNNNNNSKGNNNKNT